MVDAPSNLGLRPPAPGCVPGCYKAPGAYRDAGLLARIGAEDGGVVVAARYVPDWEPGDGVRNAGAIADYAGRLADRVAAVRERAAFPLVLGGECSIALGPALGLRRAGRYGLAYLDGHSDFRHVGNAPAVGAAGGEALALVTGRGDGLLTDHDGLSPYVRDTDAIQLGLRADDQDLAEVRGLGIAAVTSQQIVADGVDAAVDLARAVLVRPDLDGFWIHLDVDIVDGALLPAVDSPDPGGIDFAQLAGLLRGLLALPGAAGLDVGIYDPDLDPDLAYAALLTDVLVTAFG